MMRSVTILLFVTVLLVTVMDSDAHALRSKRQIYDTVADACAWLKRNVGYGCDGKSERWIWQTYNRLRYGVTDCNSYCVKKLNRRSGSCVKGAVDNSSWCPAGQSCRCS